MIFHMTLTNKRFVLLEICEVENFVENEIPGVLFPGIKNNEEKKKFSINNLSNSLIFSLDIFNKFLSYHLKN